MTQPENDWQFRPARDHGMSPGERLRSFGRERGLGGLAIAAAWRTAVRAYLASVHRLRVTGAERLPEPPFVLVANHASHLDALVMSAALPRRLARRAYALAAGDTFFTTTPAAAFAAYAVNALPVWRKRTSARDMVGMRKRLTDDGDILILFPEGTRTRTGAMGRFQPGIGALVAGLDIQVVPCFLHGAFECWPATRSLPRPGPLHLVIGEPLRFTGLPPGRAGLEAAASLAEQAVRALALQR